MEIIDNAISEIDLKTIQDLLLSPAFPWFCLLYTSPSPRDGLLSRMPCSA